MTIRILIFQFLISVALFSSEDHYGKVFFRADISWCLNLECNSEPYSPITHPVEEKCELNKRESYIKSVCKIHYIDGDFPYGNEWAIGVYGPELEEKIPGRSDNYFVFINKWENDDGSYSFGASWNSINRGMRGNWPLGDDYTFVEGYPPNGQIEDTGRFTLRNETCEFILDFTIPKILEKVDHKKEFEYSDLIDVLSYPYTNIEYTLNTYYMTLVLDDKIDELLEARLASNAKWIDEDWDGFAPNWAELNERILETQEAWKKYAKLSAREQLALWQDGSGAPSAYNRVYLKKQLDRINELKVKLK